ncbi:MAG: hypothetical protein ACRCUT_06970, partial [Spirochaetota bacterium]
MKNFIFYILGFFVIAGLFAGSFSARAQAVPENAAASGGGIPSAEKKEAVSPAVSEKADEHYVTIPFGFYFIPSVVADHKVINNFSLHILGSFAHRIDGVSLGTGVSVIAEDLNGVSLAGLGTVMGKDSRSLAASGLFNVGSGNFNGLLFAGLFNMSTGYVHGLQMSGLFNVSGGEMTGVQWGGIFNVAGGKLYGVQAGGLINSASGDVRGVQCAGIVNVAAGSVRGVQGAGIVNIAGDVNGVQAAGVGNVSTGKVRGFQGASLFNIADEVTGVQCSGLLNAAGRIKGVQLGIVNAARNADGAMIGLINVADTNDDFFFGPFTYIRKGETHGELWGDETGFLRAGIRHGNRHFYNITSIGADNKRENASIGLTFGGRVDRSGFFAGLDASQYTFLSRDGGFKEYSDKTSMQSQVRVLAGYSFLPRLSVFAGVSGNYSYTHTPESGFSPDPRLGSVRRSDNGRHS